MGLGSQLQHLLHLTDCLVGECLHCDACRAEKMRTERALRDAKARQGAIVKEVTDKTGEIMQLQAASASHADELRVVRGSCMSDTDAVPHHGPRQSYTALQPCFC